MNRFALAIFLLTMLALDVVETRGDEPRKAVREKEQALQWVGLLNNSDRWGERSDAATALKKMGPRAICVLPQLIDLFASQHDDVREFAHEIIIQLEQAAVPLLREALKHSSPNIRGCAAETLAEIGLEAKPAIPELIGLLADDTSYLPPNNHGHGLINFQVQYAARDALTAMRREAVPTLRQALSSRSLDVRRRALIILGEIGPVAEASVPDLILKVNEADADESIYGVAALVGIGVVEKRVIDSLLRALREDQELLRRSAAQALGQLGVADQRVTPALVSALREDPSAHVRGNAAAALGQFRGRPMLAIPALVTALDDIEEFSGWLGGSCCAYSSTVSMEAQRSLEQFGPHAANAVPKLIKHIENDGVAIAALGAIGQDANPATNALERLLGDEFLSTRAAEALARIDPSNRRLLKLVQNDCREGTLSERAISAGMWLEINPDLRPVSDFLLALLDGDAEEVRLNAALGLAETPRGRDRVQAILVESLEDCGKAHVARTLLKLGPPPETVPLMIQAFKGWPNSPNYWSEPQQCDIQFLKQHAPQSVPVLVEQLRKTSSRERMNATKALAEFGPLADRAAPALAKLIYDPDYKVRESAVKTIGAIGPGAKQVEKSLLDALNDKRAVVRAAAAIALSQIGTPSKTGVDTLTAMLQDDYITVQLAAKTALRTIQQTSENPVIGFPD